MKLEVYGLQSFTPCLNVAINRIRLVGAFGIYIGTYVRTSVLKWLRLG